MTDQDTIGRYLKKHTEALVKEVGIEAACAASGRSKATLGRYYSDDPAHADRFMPIDAVAAIEAKASYPHVSAALAELSGSSLSRRKGTPSEGAVSGDVILLSQRFAHLMAEYHSAILDGVITPNEAKRVLRETLALQETIIGLKLRLEAEIG